MPASSSAAVSASRVASPPRSAPAPVVFLPTLKVDDAFANHWLRQVTLRLRREISWLWHERGGGEGADNSGRLPPFRDKLATVLDLARYAEQKAAFFATDATAGYLTALLAEASPSPPVRPLRGSFSWVLRTLALDDAATFVLALGLAPIADHAAGTVFASVLNDPAKNFPTLALAQRLWDQPDEILALADPSHPLWRSGLVLRAHAATESVTLEWDAPLAVPALFAPALLFAAAPSVSAIRELPAEAGVAPPAGADLVLARLRAAPADVPHLQPLIGPPGTALGETAAILARHAGRTLLVPAPGISTPLGLLCTFAWLRGADLFVELDSSHDGHDEKFPSLPALPVTLFLGVHEKAALKRLPTAGLLPALAVPSLTYAERHELWRQVLEPVLAPGLAPAVAEAARRFRCERSAILAAGRSLVALGRPLTADDLVAACRAELNIEVSDLAQLVAPRFGEQDLMLPPKQSRQIREIITAMQALTEVHYGWGAARAWNECGLSALFAGPPGTGKTMAAEVIAGRLGLPLYRIDLSQVVNKYIGETEKNLRRLFDAADASDVVLFFDEADAIFGKRTEVKDAHDRYANLEVSYLLERMERFKGLAILATNRKKDLDEAFLRRLRYTVDFPLPGYDERLRIWRQLLPEGVDCSELNLPFLAQKLPLAGGHLRSIVFNACLQSARRGAKAVLTMPAILAAAKREYEKLDRPLSRDQLGAHVATIEKLDASP